MTSYKKLKNVYIVCAFLLFLLSITPIIFQVSDIESSEYVIRRNYLNKHVQYTTDRIMSGDILVNQTTNQVNHNRDDQKYDLVNQTSWIDYSDNWSGDILVKKGPLIDQLNFTDEYRYAMASKGLHPLNFVHKYLYERYLTMNKYCNTPLNGLYDAKGLTLEHVSVINSNYSNVLSSR